MKLIQLLEALAEDETIDEGMQNAFFLSKDLGQGSIEYPLPTGSTEYENIDSPSRGGPEVEVQNGRKTARNKKAKHATRLAKSKASRSKA